MLRRSYEGIQFKGIEPGGRECANLNHFLVLLSFYEQRMKSCVTPVTPVTSLQFSYIYRMLTCNDEE